LFYINFSLVFEGASY